MLIKILLLSIICSVQGINWQSGDEGRVQYSFNCDFNGKVIASLKSQATECGRACLGRSDCSSFLWNGYEGGTCWLKDGGDAFSVAWQYPFILCGKTVNQTAVKTIKS